MSCQSAVAVKKGKCVSEVQYGDISIKDTKALVALCNTVRKPNLEECVHIKSKINCYWKQQREALVR